MAEQLQIFLDETLILDPFQFGFYTGHVKVLIILLVVCRRHVDHCRFVLLLLLHLKAAFSIADYDFMTHNLTYMSAGDCLAMVFLLFLWSGTEGRAWQEVLTMTFPGM